MKDSLVKARIDNDLKKSVEEKLEMMGLDSSTLIRMVYNHINNFGSIPFDLLLVPKTPNEKTLKAMEEIKNNKDEEIDMDKLQKEYTK